jgi:hypothetical protein
MVVIVASPGTVDVRAMIDPQDADLACVLVYLVDHPVRASAGGPQALELPAQGMAHPRRIVGQRAEEQLDDRGGCLLG